MKKSSKAKTYKEQKVEQVAPIPEKTFSDLIDEYIKKNYKLQIYCDFDSISVSLLNINSKTILSDCDTHSYSEHKFDKYD